MINKQFCVFLLSAFCFQLASAQKPVETKPTTDTVQVVEILHADRLGFSKKDTANIIQYGAGHVSARQNRTLFNADSAVINQKLKIFEAFGNVHINEGDTTHTYSQYLRYYIDTKLAVLQKKVSLTNGRTVLTTEDLDYDMNQKIGTYRNGGKVVNGSTVLTSVEAVYYDDLKDVVFRKNVVLTDPKYVLYADSLLYNTTTEVATFIGPTRIIDSSKREILTSEGYYDTKNRVAQFGKRSTIKEGSTKLTAETIYSNDLTGKRVAEGNAVYIDSAQGISLIAGRLEEDQKGNQIVATKKPLMIIKQDQDSIYVTADTILSGRMRNADSISVADTSKIAIGKNQNDSTLRFMEAFRNVRIFSDSLQAVSDSLYYSGKDSIFRLYYDPVIWASGSQISGDTVFLFTRNKKADRLYAFENGLLVNKTGPNLYNQIMGNTLNGYFVDGNIDYMRAKGNAESIYYVKDEDSAYVGVNRTTSDIIDLRFLDKELNKVVFISDVKATTTPFRQVNFSEMRLRNFRWLEEKRPKTKYELFGD